MQKLLIAGLIGFMFTQPAPPPQAVADDLLAADRAFAAAAANTTVVPALSAMFGEDVMMPVPAPTPGFARGMAQAVEALRANPENATARLEWTPIRAGISADGQHGFTFGHMTLRRANGITQPLKYLAYWVKQPDGWRVAAYKRALADSAPERLDLMPPSLPAAIVAATRDPAVVARHHASLAAAEQAFSDEAQKIGLRASFTRQGHGDAVNVGPRSSPTFVIGAARIGESVGAGTPSDSSPVSWAADQGVLVASSGDLGITFGFIRMNAPPPGDEPPAPVPFFTIWRRASTDQPWRYVAE